jgi:hypothetical protein
MPENDREIVDNGRKQLGEDGGKELRVDLWIWKRDESG